MLLKISNGFAIVSYFLLKVKRPIGFEMVYKGFEVFLQEVLVVKGKMKPDFIIYNLQNITNPIFRPGLFKVLWMTFWRSSYM